MKIKAYLLTAVTAVALTFAGRMLLGSFKTHAPERAGAGHDMNMAASTISMLPTEAQAKNLLNTMRRHREWVDVPFRSSHVWAFLVYPERANKAPAVVVMAREQAASDWIREVADQVAAAGFIAIVPDLLTGMGPKGGDTESFSGPVGIKRALDQMGPKEIAARAEAVRSYAITLPAANGMSAYLEADKRTGKVDVSVNAASYGTASAQFVLDEETWPAVMSFLAYRTHDKPIFEANYDEHSLHFAMAAQMARNAPEIGEPGAPGGDASYAQKRPNIPAGFYTARATLAASKLQHEWVDIPVGDVKVRTWVEYPAGTGKAGVVIVMQHGAGRDEWVRSIADQLAQSGFIAVAPDAWAGTGPNGGGFDSFEYVDDAIRAGGKVNQDEIMRRYIAAREWALKLPRANGKTASIGFCMGGGHSFRMAGEVPENAAAVFYGTPPDDAAMAKIQGPVIAFYGENDARVTATAEPTIAKMKQLGKAFEPHIYPKTTHSFMIFQEVAGNPAAVKDAWPRVIELFKKQLM